MNSAEIRMLDMLDRLRDRFGAVALKAEFEAEGTRPHELQRLTDLARRAGLRVALKIGGCEAVSDLLASRVFGVDYIIAPMIETPYALSKFIAAKEKTYGPRPQGTSFLFNLETATTLRNFPEMLPMAARGTDGIVFGRVDFTQSQGLSRAAINDRVITDAVLEVARGCADNDLEFVVGGGISVDATDALREFRSVRLDRFETGKIVFDGRMADQYDLRLAIEAAATFELAWLENKRDIYQEMAAEDQSRIEMMRARTQSRAIGLHAATAAA